MEKEVYIDGDVLPYQIGFATQRKIYHLDMGGGCIRATPSVLHGVRYESTS